MKGGENMSKYLLVTWREDTHYVNGSGMSSSILLCSLSNRDDDVVATAPHRSRADEMEFLSDAPATCKWCLELAEEFQD